MSLLLSLLSTSVIIMVINMVVIIIIVIATVKLHVIVVISVIILDVIVSVTAVITVIVIVIVIAENLAKNLWTITESIDFLEHVNLSLSERTHPAVLPGALCSGMVSSLGSRGGDRFLERRRLSTKARTCFSMQCSDKMARRSVAASGSQFKSAITSWGTLVNRAVLLNCLITMTGTYW